MIAADALGDVADALIGHFVDQARRAGASWAEIGRSMGVTKRAVQKRFSSRLATEAQQGFGRFTVEARNVVVAASNQAAAARNAAISPLHLLLGLLEVDGSVVGDPEAAATVERAARAALPPAGDAVPALVPYDDAARDALAGTFAEAQRLGSEEVTPAHIALALLESDTGTLEALGLSRAAIEARLTR